MADLALGDPNATTRRVFELALADEDVRVASFPTAGELLGHIESHPVDIVFLNVSLPDGDGYRVCRQIKSSRATARIPVVLLLGAFQTFDEGRARGAGCRSHLFKPFETSQLAAMVKDILENPESEPFRLLPEGFLFKLPVGEPSGEPLFKLHEAGHRFAAGPLEREIVLPARPDLRPPAPQQEPAAGESDAEGPAAAQPAPASSEKDFEAIVEKLAAHLPQELRQLLPEVVRDLSSTKDQG